MEGLGKTLYVNLFAGPGAGKSTTAAAVFANLKRRGINCELVTEFAKDKVWEGHKKVFQDQLYLFGKQHWKLFRLQGEVDVVITDCPLLLSLVYNKIYSKLTHLPSLVLEANNKFNNINFHLTRSKVYEPKGRNQTEEEARDIDRDVLDMLLRNTGFTEVDYLNAEDRIVEVVLACLEEEKSKTPWPNKEEIDQIYDKIVEEAESIFPEEPHVETSLKAWPELKDPEVVIEMIQERVKETLNHFIGEKIEQLTLKDIEGKVCNQIQSLTGLHGICSHMIHGDEDAPSWVDFIVSSAAVVGSSVAVNIEFLDSDRLRNEFPWLIPHLDVNPRFSGDVVSLPIPRLEEPKPIDWMKRVDLLRP